MTPHEQSPTAVGRRALLAGATGAGAAGVVAAGASPAAAAVDPMSPRRLHRRVRELCAFSPRWAGYRGDRQAGRWLARRLEAAGCARYVVTDVTTNLPGSSFNSALTNVNGDTWRGLDDAARRA